MTRCDCCGFILGGHEQPEERGLLCDACHAVPPATDEEVAALTECAEEDVPC